MRHEGNAVSGFLAKYDLDHGIAVVVATSCLDVQAVCLSHVMEVEFLPCSKVVAVGSDISGKLMATSGVLTHDSSASEDCEELMLSTCTICEVQLYYDAIVLMCFCSYIQCELHYDMLIFNLFLFLYSFFFFFGLV